MPKHETRDASVRLVVGFAAGLALALVLIGAGLVPLHQLFKRLHPSPQAASRIAFEAKFAAPPPRLQVFPKVDLAQYEAAEEAKLASYGWVDRAAGIAHVPITRAMELLAERGLPTRGAGTPDASGVTSLEMQRRKAEASRQ